VESGEAITGVLALITVFVQLMIGDKRERLGSDYLIHHSKKFPFLFIAIERSLYS